MNVSDQTAIFTHKTKMLISICWKCFLAFNVLNMTRTDSWIQNFQKKRRNSPKTTICLFFTIVTHSVLLCYAAIGHFRWVRWLPKWPWAPCRWVAVLGGLAIFQKPSHTRGDLLRAVPTPLRKSPYRKNISVHFKRLLREPVECWPKLELRGAWTTLWACRLYHATNVIIHPLM